LCPYEYLKLNLDMSNLEHKKVFEELEAMKNRVEDDIITLRGSTKFWA
jgi:hypothetical protein